MASCFGGPRYALQALVGVIHSASFVSLSLLWCSLAQVLGSMAVGAVVMLQSWEFSVCWCVFPPFALIPQVLVHLQPFPGSVLSLVTPSLVATCRTLGFSFFFHLLQLHACRLSSSSPDPSASFDGGSTAWLCETSVFFSLQWSLWPVSCLWCSGSGHSVSNPSVFPDCLFIFSGLGSIEVVSVFQQGQLLYALLSIDFCSTGLGEHHVLQDLIWFLAIGWLPCPQLPSLWVWVVVLPHLFSSVSELLEVMFRALIGMTLFLVALATATRLGELRDLSKCVS